MCSRLFSFLIHDPYLIPNWHIDDMYFKTGSLVGVENIPKGFPHLWINSIPHGREECDLSILNKIIALKKHQKRKQLN